VLKLILLRHAAADWGDPGSEDFGRSLNREGEDSAFRIGGYLRQGAHVPDTVLCSSAPRAKQTLQCLGHKFSDCPEVLLKKSLYLANPKILLQEIEAIGTAAKVLLLIAHNPGIEELALGLTSRGPTRGAAQAKVEQGFTTAALAIFELEASGFEEIRFCVTNLVDFASPEILPESGFEDSH
jgi:phosphohistidine phosphatase